MRKREVQLRLFDQHFLTIIFSNFQFLKAIFVSVISTAIFPLKQQITFGCQTQSRTWRPSFLHYRKTNLGKRNEQFTEKLAIRFSICQWLAKNMFFFAHQSQAFQYNYLLQFSGKTFQITIENARNRSVFLYVKIASH